MSFTCEIENKLHQGRLNLLNNHIEEALTTFIEAMNMLENHKQNCEGEELEWTTSCFNRTLEEFNLIRSTHPEIQIKVQDSDREDEPIPEQNPQSTEDNVATEDLPASEKPATGFYENLQNFSKAAVQKMQEFDEKYKVASSISEAVNTGKENINKFFAEKSLGEHIKDGYNSTVDYCKEHQVLEKSTAFFKTAACYIYEGVIYVTKAVAKGVRGLIDKQSKPANPVYNPETATSMYAGDMPNSPVNPPMPNPPMSNPPVKPPKPDTI